MSSTHYDMHPRVLKIVMVLRNRGFLEWQPMMKVLHNDGSVPMRLLHPEEGAWKCCYAETGNLDPYRVELDKCIPDVADGATSGLFSAQVVARYPSIDFTTSVDEGGKTRWSASYGGLVWLGDSLGEVSVRALVWLRSGEEDSPESDAAPYHKYRRVLRDDSLYIVIEETGTEVRVIETMDYAHGLSPRQLLCWWNKDTCEDFDEPNYRLF